MSDSIPQWRFFVIALVMVVAAIATFGVRGTEAQAAAGWAYTIFDPPGSVNTYAACMSDNGIIAGNYYDSSNVSHGFVRAVDGTITSFDPTGSVDTAVGYAQCVNTGGSIAGSYEDADQVWHGYVYANGAITIFDPKGSIYTSATSINSDGTIVGSYDDGNGDSRAFLRRVDGSIKSFQPGDSIESWAQQVNRSGEILGGNIDSDQNTYNWVYYGHENYRYVTNGTTDVNDNADVTGSLFILFCHGVGTYCYKSFLEPPAGKTKIFAPHNSSTSSGNCINQKGLVAGTYQTADGSSHGYTRSLDRTIQYFDPPGSTGTSVTGCDASGDVTGYYLDSNGVSHGFLRSKSGVKVGTLAVTHAALADGPR